MAGKHWHFHKKRPSFQCKIGDFSPMKVNVSNKALHAKSLPPCLSKLQTKFKILSMVMDTLIRKNGCTPILSVSVKKIKGAAHQKR